MSGMGRRTVRALYVYSDFAAVDERKNKRKLRKMAFPDSVRSSCRRFPAEYETRQRRYPSPTYKYDGEITAYVAIRGGFDLGWRSAVVVLAVSFLLARSAVRARPLLRACAQPPIWVLRKKPGVPPTAWKSRLVQSEARAAVAARKRRALRGVRARERTARPGRLRVGE